jgi:hypothetical protein
MAPTPFMSVSTRTRSRAKLRRSRPPRRWRCAATPDVAIVDLPEKNECERHGTIPGLLHTPFPDLQENISAGGILPGLDDAIVAKLDSELFLESFLDVDLGDDAEASCLRAFVVRRAASSKPTGSVLLK